ncbi:MAG: FAD-dependent tricarballylate dehydrogenase TcuA [Antricoccus sp.]
MNDDFDVIVVGGGNAGFCAAHAARQTGALVLILEKASPDEAGGNSFYTAGAFRFAYPDQQSVVDLVEPDPQDRLARTVIPPYPQSAFTEDMYRVTDGKCDPPMTEILVSQSSETMRWLRDCGLRFRLSYERQAYETDSIYTFFGGLAVITVDGGKGLVAQHTAAARATGIELRYDSPMTDLVLSDGAVTGVRYRDSGGAAQTVNARSVILTAGGFESNPAMRAKYLGPDWEHALVRGTPSNTGEVLQCALDHGAAPFGDWSSCHSVQWESGAAPGGGNRELTNQLTRQSYPIGIVVNAGGERFVDEGADFRNYTYAKYGQAVLAQPGGVAYQIFDAKTRPLLRSEEYDSEPITSATADSIEELASKLGIDIAAFADTVRAFNASIDQKPFQPEIKDGRRANVVPPKSNWALEIDTPPFYGYAVACGITFTFGGVQINEKAQVLGSGGSVIPGLYAAGEIVGGLFSGNYPGASGLTAGAVFGRIAGTAAVQEA